MSLEFVLSVMTATQLQLAQPDIATMESVPFVKPVASARPLSQMIITGATLTPVHATQLILIVLEVITQNAKLLMT